ncbi:MAG: CPBP family intramembrane glutamic endopeptidase [Terriglobia bacterium]
MFIAVMAWAGAGRSVHPVARVDLYERTILLELLLLGVVLLGVRFYGGPVDAVLGPRWRSPLQLARDVAIGLGFWAVNLTVTSTLGSLGPHGGDNSAVAFLIPHGGLEAALWVLVSLTAGICEEAVYRGYLQRQCLAFTQHVAPAILLPALAFALVHLYQGWERAAVIGCGGVLSGALAHWRRSVRPGMIAHVWQDATAPLLMKLVGH